MDRRQVEDAYGFSDRDTAELVAAAQRLLVTIESRVLESSEVFSAEVCTGDQGPAPSDPGSLRCVSSSSRRRSRNSSNSSRSLHFVIVIVVPRPRSD